MNRKITRVLSVALLLASSTPAICQNITLTPAAFQRALTAASELGVRRYKEKIEPWVIRSDEVTPGQDITDLIQAKIDAHKICVVPHGVYRIRFGGITLPKRIGVQLLGAGFSTPNDSSINGSFDGYSTILVVEGDPADGPAIDVHSTQFEVGGFALFSGESDTWMDYAGVGTRLRVRASSGNGGLGTGKGEFHHIAYHGFERGHQIGNGLSEPNADETFHFRLHWTNCREAVRQVNVHAIGHRFSHCIIGSVHHVMVVDSGGNTVWDACTVIQAGAFFRFTNEYGLEPNTRTFVINDLKVDAQHGSGPAGPFSFVQTDVHAPSTGSEGPNDSVVIVNRAAIGGATPWNAGITRGNQQLFLNDVYTNGNTMSPATHIP